MDHAAWLAAFTRQAEAGRAGVHPVAGPAEAAAQVRALAERMAAPLPPAKTGD